MTFRDFHKDCPSVYTDNLNVDQEDWDNSLQHDSMKEQYDLWCNPAEVDITFAMEEKLMEVKSVMLNGLEAVMARGENIQVL